MLKNISLHSFGVGKPNEMLDDESVRIINEIRSTTIYHARTVRFAR